MAVGAASVANQASVFVIRNGQPNATNAANRQSIANYNIALRLIRVRIL